MWILLIIIPIVVITIILIDYFLINKFTKDMEKSINVIFDRLSNLKLVIFIMTILNIGGNDEDKS